MRLLRGALLLAATGMIQVLAQLTLNRLLEILPHPRQSSAPTLLANFTTVGASDITLPPLHRMVGALESAAGMLMFGWSTALLVHVVQRTDRNAQEE